MPEGNSGRNGNIPLHRKEAKKYNVVLFRN